MGADIGFVYVRLWNRLAHLHFSWGHYCGLFGKSQAEFDVMNGTAGGLFKTIQDSLWETILLDLANFVDWSRDRPLSLRRLDHVIPEDAIPSWKESLEIACVKCKFAKDWRHRRIAHWDFAHEKDTSAKPLAAASRTNVREALNAITDALNVVETHFLKTSTFFEGDENQARHLIHELDLINKIRNERKDRLLNGTNREDDTDWKRWNG